MFHKKIKTKIWRIQIFWGFQCREQVTEAIKNYFKIQIDYSDHKLIYVDMKINVQKIQKNSTTARDYRKIRSNPNFS